MEPVSTKETDMEATMLFVISLIGLIALSGASFTWGVDSREEYRDDHAR